MSLQTTATQPPSIAVAATTAGDVPLFATVGADGSVRVRALSSWWAPVADALCTDGPSLAVDGRTLYVGCTAADGTQSMTTVALDAYGRPTPSAPAAQAGPSDPAPPPAPVRATSVTLS
jgi:hypothetical protein